MNKLLGMICLTAGGGLVGAGIQRTYLVGNKIASGMSKLLGKGVPRFDETTWVFLIAGGLVLLAGVWLSLNDRGRRR